MKAAVLLATCFIFGSVSAESVSISDSPLSMAHAHNDYVHDRPLIEALEHGFTSIEVDVHLMNGELIAAHTFLDRWAIRIGNTLGLNKLGIKPIRRLSDFYLHFLHELTLANTGRVYPSYESPVVLLVDIKTDADKTYAVLKEVLKPFASMLTRYSNGKTIAGAVTVIISGERPRALLEAETDRFASMDGRLSDLNTDVSTVLMPLISDNWNNNFDYRGDGQMSVEEQTKLRSYAAQVHKEGRILRFWATPDHPNVWRELTSAGVDLIGADDLDGLEVFLRGK